MTLKLLKIKSSYVSADNMPDYVKGAFISMEDERFYKHHGFDVKRYNTSIVFNDWG